MRRCGRRWKSATSLYAKPHEELTDEDGMRLGELEGIVGEEGGYTAESDAAVLLDGLGVEASLHERRMGELQGGQKVRVLLAQALFGSPPALLLDEPTNHLDLDSVHWLQDYLLRLPGRADRDFARPAFSEQRLHARSRYRLRNGHPLHRRVRRHGARQDADPLAHRSGERAAREEDRPAQRIHRALFGGHAVEPGDVAQEGSGAAADFGTGEVEYPAAVHPFRNEAALGPASAGGQGPGEVATTSYR